MEHTSLTSIKTIFRSLMYHYFPMKTGGFSQVPYGDGSAADSTDSTDTSDEVGGA